VSGFVSRWVVSEQHDVGPDDLDDDGFVRDEARDRWISSASAAYLDRCRALSQLADATGLSPTTRIGAWPESIRLLEPSAVVVSVRATEFVPDSFRLAVRVRSPDVVVDIDCLCTLEDESGHARELGDDVRDELIAFEHAAQHVN
jgi:hypothetical protein